MKKGFLSLLLLGIVAVLLLLGIFIFGPWELPGFGQLSQRQVDQAIAAAEVPTIPPNDSDQDGFDDETEEYLRTDRSDNCADDTSDAAWPPDLNNDKLVNNNDIDLIKSRIFKKAVGQNRRYDLNKDKTVNIGDVIILGKFLNKGCPFYFLSVESLTQGVSFRWQPAISELPVGLYGIDLTDTGKTQCSSPEDFVGGFAWAYDLKAGQASYTGDSSSTGSFSIKFKPGHTYCAYLFKTGGGALSSYVTYTLPAPSPIPSPSPATALPSAPTNVFAYRNLCLSNGKTQIAIYWTDNSNNEVGFKIEVRKDSENNFTQIAELGSTSGTGKQSYYLWNNADDGVKYIFRVGAYNSAGVNWADYNGFIISTPCPSPQ